DNVNLLLGCGIVPALVKHLQEPQWPNEAVIGFDEFATCSRSLEHEVEKASAFTIGLLAIKSSILNCKTVFDRRNTVIDGEKLFAMIILKH
nr:hypothetical protein [Tanacetum cinerariifolium]